ncbi:MAG: PKD domain-containing protein, partial [Chloroflexota bacterium]|nr:PKD domain-containing protein [Chloroflexota bacterium]
TRTITIANTGQGTLHFDARTGCVLRLTASESRGDQGIPYLALDKGEEDPRQGPLVTQGFDGPDVYGYYWIDSDEPGGPLYEWIELQGAGTDSGIHVDDEAVAVDVGFDFQFYGESYSQVMIAEDGYLSFTDYGGSAYTNQPIPHDSIPNSIVAPFWDDHYTPAGGTILYDTMTVGERSLFVVEWHEVPLYGDPMGSSLTYEVVLTSDGEILFHYKTVSDGQSASVGIENAAGSDGLCVSFNAANVHDGLSVLVASHPFWLRVEPQCGAVAASESQQLAVVFDARGLSPGTLSGEVVIVSNDLDESLVTLAATLEVLQSTEPAAPDFSANVNSGVAPLEVQFIDQSTGDVVGWFWDFGDGCTSTERNPVHRYISDGRFTVSLTVTDSNSVEFLEVKADYIVVDRAGDANQDGVINALDMTSTERIIVGVDSPTPGADANGDGSVNALDITRIELMIAEG